MSNLPNLLSHTTTPSDRPGTFAGMFGHSNINKPDSWSWSSAAKTYRDEPERRREELERHKGLEEAERTRHPERYKHLQTSYQRGLASNDSVKMGTVAMGQNSRIEAIASRPLEEGRRGPIPEDRAREDVHDVHEKAHNYNKRANNYNPILGA